MKNIAPLIAWMIPIFLFLIPVTTSIAGDWQESGSGKTAVFTMTNAPFPDSSRTEGYQRNDEFYPSDQHYNSPDVAVFIPSGFNPESDVNLLFYFHGHSSSIERSFQKFSLREMVAESEKNLILIFPQGPKNARDSSCGKLERQQGFRKLVNEVLDTLAAENVISRPQVGSIILSGHSGAYKVIGQILHQGGLTDKISEVYLLDATYGQLDIFEYWAGTNQRVILRSVFTDHLAANNVTLMKNLARQNIKYVLLPEEETSAADLETRILFLHAANLDHNQTVSWLGKFLSAGNIKNRQN